MFALPWTYSLRPPSLFNASWYMLEYPDTATFGSSAWVHFVRHGDAEGRNPGPGFDANFYRRTYLPIAIQSSTRAFAHYTRYGRAQGLLPRRESRTRDYSAAAMADVLRPLTNPVLLIGNDAQRAGSPIMLLELAAHLQRRGYTPVFLLERGGPLLTEYRRCGPTVIVDEGWDLLGLGDSIAPRTPVIANTAWSGKLLDGMQLSVPATLMIHEMPAYLTEHRLSDGLGSATHVIASFPNIRDGIAAWIPATTELHVVTPGLFEKSRNESERRTVSRQLTRAFGAERTVYVGAGYADRRKGFDLFLDAAREIHTRSPQSGFVWLGELSEWATDLARQARGAGLPLLLPGFREAAVEWYAQADAYLLTSRSDPGPTTVMDAARVGVPFVGYTADLGLRSIEPLLRGVGSFVESPQDFVERAMEIAGSQDVETRASRAKAIEEKSSFTAYADRVLEIAAGDRAAVAAPARVVAPAKRRRERSRRAAASREDSLDARAERSFVSLLDRVVRRVSRAWHRRPTRLLTVIVDDGAGTLPARTLAGRGVVHLSTVEELPSVSRPAVVYLARDRGASPWPVVSALQESRGVAELTQFDRLHPPGWIVGGERPPAPGLDRSVPRMHESVELRPAEQVELGRPIGVFLHLYYTDLAVKLVERIAQIDHPVRLYVSTDTEEKARILRELSPEATVRVFPNRGQDIAPKLYGFKDVYSAHDIVLHVHGKRTPHARVLSGWLDHILDRLLPSPKGINAILSRFAEVESLGMVSPAPFPLVAPSLGWSANRPLAEALVWEAGWLPLPDNDELRFPAGSMFWARTEALRPLLDLDVPTDVFLANGGRPDGTVAHAIERLYGVSCETAGLEHLMIEAPGVNYRVGDPDHG